MLSKDLNICLFPMSIKWDDMEANFAEFETAVFSIHPQTDLIVLPETFTTGFPVAKDKSEILRMASCWEETIEWLKKVSSARNMAICGTIIAEGNGMARNRAFFIEPSGDVAYADKRHLFTMAGEQKHFEAGNRRLLVRYRGWNIGMIVCYDVRFPVWCRNVNNEYDLLVAVANWPESRVSAWNALLDARAIENQAYVCGVDCKGTDNAGNVYDGSSKVIDFKGKNISVADSDQGFIYATLSRDRLDAFRTKFPAWRDADPFTLL